VPNDTLTSSGFGEGSARRAEDSEKQEACSIAGLPRPTALFHGERTANSNGLLKAPLHRSLLDHVKDLLTRLRDQRAAVRELRRSVIELRHEGSAQRPVRPPPDIRAVTSRTR
jgi:hypothetical protein